MIKRYEMISDRELNCVCEIDECATGDYVLYSDYVAYANDLLSHNDVLVQEVDRLFAENKLLHEEIKRRS